MIGRGKGELHLFIKVTRADGEVIDLGQVDRRFPWRVWRYRVRTWFERRR